MSLPQPVRIGLHTVALGAALTCIAVRAPRKPVHVCPSVPAHVTASVPAVSEGMLSRMASADRVVDVVDGERVAGNWARAAWADRGRLSLRLLGVELFGVDKVSGAHGVHADSDVVGVVDGQVVDGVSAVGGVDSRVASHGFGAPPVGGQASPFSRAPQTPEVCPRCQDDRTEVVYAMTMREAAERRLPATTWVSEVGPVRETWTFESTGCRYTFLSTADPDAPVQYSLEYSSWNLVDGSLLLVNTSRGGARELIPATLEVSEDGATGELRVWRDDGSYDGTWTSFRRVRDAEPL